MKRLSLILVILWMLVIFMFSNTPSTKSTKESNFVVKGVVYIFNYKADPELLVKPVRKLAHFTIYLILGLLVINACSYYNYKDIIKLSILICMLYACSDEIHQLFISGRSGQVFDVMIDTLGSSLGIFIYKKVLRK